MSRAERPLSDHRPAGVAVFVAGTAHSGSTVVDLMLGQRPDAVSCGEIAAAYSPSRPHHLLLECRCGDDDCTVWRERTAASRRSFHARLLEQHRVVVDSSKALGWIASSARHVERAGHRAVVVAAWKSPSDLAQSFHRRGGARALPAAIDNFVGYYPMLMSLGVPMVSAPNHEIRADPAGAVERISAAIGIEPVDRQEEFWRGQRHYVFGSASAADQVAIADERPDAAPPAEFLDDWAAASAASERELERVGSLLESISYRTIDVARVVPTAQLDGLRTFTPRRRVHHRLHHTALTAALTTRHPVMAGRRLADRGRFVVAGRRRH